MDSTEEQTTNNRGAIVWIIIIIAVIIGLIYWFAGRNSNELESGHMANADNVSEKVNIMNATIKTNFGDIKVELFENKAPLTVRNFTDLAKAGFYNGTLFHRVIKDFMIQGGDPLSKESDWSMHGRGGPGYTFKDEINDEKVARGALAMANAGPGTNGSQFFVVTTEAAPWLDGKHTVFGRVIGGMDVVDKIEAVEVNDNDHPLEDVVVESIVLE